MPTRYIDDTSVVAWIRGDAAAAGGHDRPLYRASKPVKKKKPAEDSWGKALVGVLPEKKSWSGKLGEGCVAEMMSGLGLVLKSKPKVCVGIDKYEPDFEIMSLGSRVFVEVKTQSWHTTGTAGEKIAGVMSKYASVCANLGPVIVVAIAGAEREAEKLRLFDEEWISPEQQQYGVVLYARHRFACPI